MKYWNELDGTILLNKVFSKPIEISNIDIFNINIDREGPTVVIPFDLIDQLPDTPPPKWSKGFNRCRCGINCGNVSSIKISGISTTMIANIRIIKGEIKSEVFISGENLDIYIECSHIQFMGPSVYISN